MTHSSFTSWKTPVRPRAPDQGKMRERRPGRKPSDAQIVPARLMAEEAVSLEFPSIERQARGLGSPSLRAGRRGGSRNFKRSSKIRARSSCFPSAPGSPPDGRAGSVARSRSEYRSYLTMVIRWLEVPPPGRTIEAKSTPFGTGCPPSSSPSQWRRRSPDTTPSGKRRRTRWPFRSWSRISARCPPSPVNRKAQGAGTWVRRRQKPDRHRDTDREAAPPRGVGIHRHGRGSGRRIHRRLRSTRRPRCALPMPPDRSGIWCPLGPL